jgi:hypothetical protein
MAISQGLTQRLSAEEVARAGAFGWNIVSGVHR